MGTFQQTEPKEAALADTFRSLPAVESAPEQEAVAAAPAVAIAGKQAEPERAAEVMSHWTEGGVASAKNANVETDAFNEKDTNGMIKSGDAKKRAAALAEVVAKMKGEGRDFSVVKGGAPVYDDSNPTYGEASRENPSVITIGTAGMGQDAKFLQLIIEHELVHAHQWQDPKKAEDMGRAEREFLATAREFELADTLDLKSKDRAYNLLNAQAKLKGWYDSLSADKQKTHKAVYDSCMAMKLDK